MIETKSEWEGEDKTSIKPKLDANINRLDSLEALLTQGEEVTDFDDEEGFDHVEDIVETCGYIPSNPTLSPSRSEVIQIRSGSLHDSPKVVVKKPLGKAEGLSPEKLTAAEKEMVIEPLTSVLKETEGGRVAAVKKENALDSQLMKEPQGEDQLDVEAQYDSEWDSEDESDEGKEEEEEDGTASAVPGAAAAEDKKEEASGSPQADTPKSSFSFSPESVSNQSPSPPLLGSPKLKPLSGNTSLRDLPPLTLSPSRSGQMPLPPLGGSPINKQGLTPKKNLMVELLSEQDTSPSGASETESEWEREVKANKAAANKISSSKVTKHVQFDSEINTMMTNETAPLQVNPKPLKVAQLQETKPAILVSTSELELQEMEKQKQLLEASLEEVVQGHQHSPEEDGWVSPTQRKGEPMKAKPSVVPKVTMAQLVEDEWKPGEMLNREEDAAATKGENPTKIIEPAHRHKEEENATSRWEMEQLLEASLEEADQKHRHSPKHGRRSLKAEQDELEEAAKRRQYERDNEFFLVMQSRQKKKVSGEGGWVSPTQKRKGEPVKAKSAVDTDDELGQPLVPKVTMSQLVRDKWESGEMLSKEEDAAATKGENPTNIIEPARQHKDEENAASRLEMEKQEQLLEASLEEADQKHRHSPKHGRRSLKAEQDELEEAAKRRQYERDNEFFLVMQSRQKKISGEDVWVSPTQRKGEPVKAKSLPSVVDTEDELGKPLVPKVMMAQLVKDKREPGEMLSKEGTAATKGDNPTNTIEPALQQRKEDKNTTATKVGIHTNIIEPTGQQLKEEEATISKGEIPTSITASAHQQHKEKDSATTKEENIVESSKSFSVEKVMKVPTSTTSSTVTPKTAPALVGLNSPLSARPISSHPGSGHGIQRKASDDMEEDITLTSTDSDVSYIILYHATSHSLV